MITALRSSSNSHFKIKVVGIGGAGGNIVQKIFLNGLKCETIILNTDVQALSRQRAHHLIPIGRNVTRGGGAGADPDLGKKAAEESIHEVLSKIEDSDLLLIVAGLGNGTGTGASPVITKYAREKRILTIGVFTLPFEFEAKKNTALKAIEEMEKNLNTMIIIDNNMINEVVSLESSVKDAYGIVDEVVKNCVESIISVVQDYSEINVDFNDLKALITRGGLGYFSKGIAEKAEDVPKALTNVLYNPLLNGVSIKEINGALVNVKTNGDLKMSSFTQIMNEIRNSIPDHAGLKYGLLKEGDKSVKNYAEIYFIGTTGKTDSDDMITKISSKKFSVHGNLDLPPGVRKHKK